MECYLDCSKYNFFTPEKVITIELVIYQFQVEVTQELGC